MKKENEKNLYFAIFALVLFILWTVAIRFIDVKTIGPRGSEVGFATLNEFVHRFLGINMCLYVITDWLSLIPVGFSVGFALLGLMQWIKRKKIARVDYSILVLEGFYLLVFGFYILFEEIVINYRPVLINGFLEASYPSSTTILVTCIMPTAIMQLNARIKREKIALCISFLLIIFTVFMIAGRMISGVHWFTDIIGGALLSAGLVLLYRYFIGIKQQ